jgi:transposase
MNIINEYKQTDDLCTRNVHIVFESNNPNIAEIVSQFKAFLIAVGYHPDTISEYINDD